MRSLRSQCMAVEERRRAKGNKASSAASTGGLAYDGPLTSNILLDESDGGCAVDLPPSAASKQPLYSLGGSSPQERGGGAASTSGRHSARQLAPHQRADGEARKLQASNRTPTRTPSPVSVYQWNHPKDRFHSADGPPESWAGAEGQPDSQVAAREGADVPSAQGRSSSSTSRAGGEPQAEAAVYPPMQFPFFPPAYWSGGFNAQAYFGMYSPQEAAAVAAAAAEAVSYETSLEGDGTGMDSGVWQMMLMQAALASAAQGGPNLGPNSHASASSTSPQQSKVGAAASDLGVEDLQDGKCPDWAARPQDADGKRTKSRQKDKEMPVVRQGSEPASHAQGSAAVAQRGDRSGPGAKNDRRRRGSGGGEGGVEERPVTSGKPRSMDMRPQSSNPLIEQLKQRDRNVELSDLAPHIAEIAQDQYGSRLIQQKLEVANEEEKQIAFKSVLQKMPLLTTDVFGNYVIQKFFEYGNSEQKRILAEQLVGQVLKLSLQMYGCRVVQKALDSVPIEQQVLLIGELKGHVLKCIEDQHGNHVIQKCIERLPTDRIGFIVESFLGQTSRMAKHCYGCRVIQRLIEYCASAQISPLLEEVLMCSMDLATDQYGNYVVQHVVEHSSRPGDRQNIMMIVRKNILSLSCHKYASNVIEKALACGNSEERGALIYAIIGEQGDTHPPLLTMMRDRFGNYIVQKVIALAQGPQREALLWKLHEHMPVLKKSNTYGKHIITALEKAQGNSKE